MLNPPVPSNPALNMYTRLITRSRKYIFSNISKGTAYLLQSISLSLAVCQCALLSVVGGRGGVRKEGKGQKVKKGAKKVDD